MTDNNQSILLVEDNEVNRDMLVRRLQRAGHQVTTAGDGEAALETMRQQQPAVVLMDMVTIRMVGLPAGKHNRTRRLPNTHHCADGTRYGRRQASRLSGMQHYAANRWTS